MAEERPNTDEPSSQRTTIDATFRNGSLTAIGVVAGFSLSFLSRWAATPGEWSIADLFAVAAITLGIAFQIKALANLLSVTSLILTRYNRAVRIFMVGLILVAVGVVLAIFADIVGYDGIALSG
jgi:hypothetical protein